MFCKHDHFGNKTYLRKRDHIYFPKAYFHDEKAAFSYLESVIWADGPVCPHCSGFDRITKGKSNAAKRIYLGLYRCDDCNRQFTVKICTVFEHGHIPLNKMLQPVYLMTSSKKFIVCLRLPTNQYDFWPTASGKPCQWRSDAVRL